MRFEELRCKEIINICTGQRLGYVYDAVLDFPSGCVRALIVPGPARFFGFFGREPDFLIPLDRVTRMGKDVILVEISGSYDRDQREKKRRWM